MLASAVRWLRYLFLVLCSPILLPFLCLADLCLRRRTKVDDDRLRRAEEGTCGVDDEEEISLLQRYLEDQLVLAGSVYDCGDDTFLTHQRTPLLA